MAACYWHNFCWRRKRCFWGKLPLIAPWGLKQSAVRDGCGKVESRCGVEVLQQTGGGGGHFLLQFPRYRCQPGRPVQLKNTLTTLQKWLMSFKAKQRSHGLLSFYGEQRNAVFHPRYMSWRGVQSKPRDLSLTRRLRCFQMRWMRTQSIRWPKTMVWLWGGREVMKPYWIPIWRWTPPSLVRFIADGGWA